MADRRQVLRAILLGAAGLAVPAACGLPTGGQPIVDGPGPAAGPGASGAEVEAPVPADADSAVSLVQGFLGAVAGKLDTDGDLNNAKERAAKFLTGKAQKTWVPGNQVTVVRVVGDLTQSNSGEGVIAVEANLEPVGTLQTNGTVGLFTGALGRRRLKFDVVGAGASQRIDAISSAGGGPSLSGMMLDSARLDGDLYVPQLVYFWSTDPHRLGLVPDLRYLPRVGLSREFQRTEIVNWMLGDPSDLLASAVLSKVYVGTTLLGPNLVAPDSNGLLVNLSALPPPQGLSLDDVMAQLRWSLRPSYEGAVRLQVNSQNQQVNGSSNAYRGRNLADQPSRSGDATEFCVANGAVRTVAAPYAMPAPVNDPDVNKNVRYAALSRDLRHAALVKSDGWLYVGGRLGGPKPAFTRADLSGTTWTRPAFLPANDPVALVAVDGSLYAVTMDGHATPVDVGHAVRAFCVAPDGHRIALVADGEAWVGALRVDGTNISLGALLRPINSGLTDLTGIAWSRLDRVLIAGKASTYQLSETTIDGAIADVWTYGYSYPITSVVALPYLPWEATTIAGPAMVYTQQGAAYHASPGAGIEILLDATGTPSPSPSGGEPVSLGKPSNPFYLD